MNTLRSLHPPPAVIRQLHGAFGRAAEAEALLKRGTSEGPVITLDSPEETTRIVRAEEAKWRRVVKEQSIKPE